MNRLGLPEWYTGEFILNLAGFLSLLIVTVAVSIIGVFTYHRDLFTWRSSTFGGQAGNHILTELAVILLAWFILIYESGRVALDPMVFRGKKYRFVKIIYKYPWFNAALSALFVCSAVQILWYIPYIATYGYTPLIIPRWLPYPPFIGSLWAIVSPLGIFAYLIYNRGFTKADAYFISALLGFYLIWYIIGFPLTLRFEGATAYLYNDVINSLEITSWIYACAVYFIFRTEVYRKPVMFLEKITAH